MKNKYVWIIFFFLIHKSYAQTNLTIEVYDSDTKEELVFANTFLEKNNIGSATGLSGVATLNLKKGYIQKDVLTVSFIGYDNHTQEILFPQENPIKVYLKSKYTDLNEVAIVVKVDNSTGVELVEKAIKNIKKNYPKKELKLQSYYKEQVFEEGQSIELNESINNITYTAYPQKNYVRKSNRNYWALYEIFEEIIANKKPEATSKTESKRENIVGLILGNPQFFKYYNTVKDSFFIKSKRFSKNTTQYNVKPDIFSGPLALTAIDKVKYLSDFLDPKLVDDYDYFRKESKLVDGVKCFAVGFKPRLINNFHNVNWTKKMQYPIYSGTVYISKEDYAIVKFESQVERTPVTERYNDEPWQIFPTSMQTEVSYAKNGSNRWQLASVISKQFVKANSSKKWKIPADYICVRELYVLDRKLNTLEKYPNKRREQFLDVNRMNLRNFLADYRAEVWEEFEKTPQYININQISKSQEAGSPQ